MYKEITGFDLLNNHNKVANNIDDNARAMINDLYIIIEGRNIELPQDVKDDLLYLAKKIQNYFQKPIDKSIKV